MERAQFGEPFFDRHENLHLLFHRLPELPRHPEQTPASNQDTPEVERSGEHAEPGRERVDDPATKVRQVINQAKVDTERLNEDLTRAENQLATVRESFQGPSHSKRLSDASVF